jgi:hypothetical protein
MNGTAWTEQQITDLQLYWSLGISCRSIAEIVGKTRNAVIGKAKRLSLPEHKLKGDYGLGWRQALTISRRQRNG